MTPILFLDIDGVLVTERHVRVQYAREGGTIFGTACEFDPACVAIFNGLIQRTDPDVVISSSWRLFLQLPELKERLAKEGVQCRVVGETKDLYGVERGLEIADYLREPNHTGPFCILDDDTDMSHMKPFLVQTTWATGLQPEHVERAVQMMKGEL